MVEQLLKIAHDEGETVARNAQERGYKGFDTHGILDQLGERDVCLLYTSV